MPPEYGGIEMSEPILKMSGINKQFPGVIALKDAWLNVDKGEVHILVGENGAGKSTLIKILTGAYQKDGGSVEFDGQRLENPTPREAQDAGISIIYQEFNSIPQLSVAENVFLGREELFMDFPRKINWKKLFNRTTEMLDELGIQINVRAKLKSLSVAQQQMVEIAKALSLNSKLIIMDEPTAALSENEIKTLFDNIRKIRDKGVSVIYISHRLEEFSQIGDRVTVMRDGETIKTLRISETNTDELIRLMVGREIVEMYPKVKVEPGKEVLRVEHLNRKGVLKDISFTLSKGEVLGIGGLMGAGRTELARAIFGADSIDSGKLYIEGKEISIRSPRAAINAGIGFITEDRKTQGLVLKMSIGENMTMPSLDNFVHFTHIDMKAEREAVNASISKLKIKTPSSKKKAMDLSGGNQQKVIIAKWLMTKSKIFIFDEPTRGIDVGAKYEVYNLMNQLVAEGAGIILISSDLPELLGMSDRLVVLCRGEMVAEVSIEEVTQEKVLYYATGGGKYIE